MARSSLAALISLLVLVVAAATALACDDDAPRSGQEGPRLVSLAPAITETVFALGAGEQLVGVSDYCARPERACRLPRVGTGLSPNYEAIVRLRPTAILTEDMKNAEPKELARLAPLENLPWLSLAQVIEGTRRLGVVTGRRAEAEGLAHRLENELEPTPPETGPRVLLVFEQGPGPLREVWYIRQNSLHGAALHAAGAKNAVDRDVAGTPKLSVEELIRVDPDIVIVLHDSLRRKKAPSLDAWRALTPLRAVKNERVVVLNAPEAYSNGPSILELEQRLTNIIAELDDGARPTQSDAAPTRSNAAP